LPDILKIDIEGAEMLALKGAIKLLNERHPVVFLATHGQDMHRECCNLLTDIGYKVSPIDSKPLEYSKEVIVYFDK